jgi:predicted dehydrogenase
MQVRWGLLGCGDIARKRVARAISDDPHSRLVAACRRDPSRLQAFCSAFGVERAYTRDADLLADRRCSRPLSQRCQVRSSRRP